MSLKEGGGWVLELSYGDDTSVVYGCSTEKGPGIKFFPRLRTHALALGQSDQGTPGRRVDLRVAWRRATAEVRATEE